MKEFYFTHRSLNRSEGIRAVEVAAFNSRNRLTDTRLGKTFDYTTKSDVIYSEIILPENAPQWMKNREMLWNDVEGEEKRKNSWIAQEIELNLPIELKIEQKIELLRDYVKKYFNQYGIVVDLNIYEDSQNPYAVILLTTRAISGSRFAEKRSEWAKKEMILYWKTEWEYLLNSYIKKIDPGYSDKINVTIAPLTNRYDKPLEW